MPIEFLRRICVDQMHAAGKTNRHPAFVGAGLYAAAHRMEAQPAGSAGASGLGHLELRGCNAFRRGNGAGRRAFGVLCFGDGGRGNFAGDPQPTVRGVAARAESGVALQQVLPRLGDVAEAPVHGHWHGLLQQLNAGHRGIGRARQQSDCLRQRHLGPSRSIRSLPCQRIGSARRLTAPDGGRRQHTGHRFAALPVNRLGLGWRRPAWAGATAPRAATWARVGAPGAVGDRGSLSELRRDDRQREQAQSAHQRRLQPVAPRQGRSGGARRRPAPCRRLGAGSAARSPSLPSSARSGLGVLAERSQSSWRREGCPACLAPAQGSRITLFRINGRRGEEIEFAFALRRVRFHAAWQFRLPFLI